MGGRSAQMTSAWHRLRQAPRASAADRDGIQM